jgi:cell division initiation protein
MDLSPNDIRTYEFPSQMRGYDKDEVDTFLDQTALALENAKQSNLNLSMEVDSLKTQIATLKEYEDAIKKATIDARRNADATVENAKNEADQITHNAREKAEAFVGNKEIEVQELNKQIQELEDHKKSFISEVRNMINSHLDKISDVEIAEIDTGNIDLSDSDSNIQVTESADITRDTMETVASTPTSEDAVQPEESPKEIDPELAQALKQYQKPTTISEEPDHHEHVESTLDDAPKPGEFVETDKSANDVPDGFVAGNKQEENNGDTDKVNLSQKNKTEKPPANLADELDSVVATFEKEMDKADKS